MPLNKIPFLGAGLGFRGEIKDEILSAAERIDFLEVIADQYLGKSRFRKREAAELARKFPLVLHSVDLSVGTDSPTDETYLENFRRLGDLTQAKWTSDHLCFTRVPGNSLAQLTPLSFSNESVKIAVRNIKRIANTLGRPFLVENISYYFLVPQSEMTEAEFITRVVSEAECWLLLDLTNVRNNGINNGYDSLEFLDQLPLDRVVQLHLAGSSYLGDLLIDSHSHPIAPEVFDMLRYVAPKLPALKGVLVERDQNYPPIEELLAELDHVRSILRTEWAPHHLVGPIGASRLAVGESLRSLPNRAS